VNHQLSSGDDVAEDATTLGLTRTICKSFDALDFFKLSGQKALPMQDSGIEMVALQFLRGNNNTASGPFHRVRWHTHEQHFFANDT
jgi:hypothetical protein